MDQTYTVEIRNGVVVFDEGTPHLPEGSRYRLVPIEPATIVAEDDSTPTLAERLRPIIGAARGFPPDMAEHHDHYLHGTPKR